MKRILYHGSDRIIEEPIYGYGNVHNDYGLGFYCCTNLGLAKEWASRKFGKGFVNKYELRDDRLKILDLTKGDYNNILIWVALLIKNRILSGNIQQQYKKNIDFLLENYLIDVTKYDVVIGYRADDAYFKFPESFISNNLTVESLDRIYKAGDLGKQYVLISKRAFRLVKFIDFIETDNVAKESFYKRVIGANKEYNKYINTDLDIKENKIEDLIKKHDRK